MKRQRFSTFRSPPIRALFLAVIACAAIALKPKPASAEAALLVDADSGRVLYAENATQPWYPASVTKIMTAFVILKAVKEGRISFDTPFTVSENAVASRAFDTPTDERWAAAFKSEGVDPRLLSSETGAA